MTYAERYFLLKYFHIATDEDDIDNPKVQEKLFIDISQTTNETQLQEIWNKNPELHNEVDFRKAINLRKKQLESKLPTSLKASGL